MYVINFALSIIKLLEEWMYGQIIGKQGKTLVLIKAQAGLKHVYMDINNG